MIKISKKSHFSIFSKSILTYKYENLRGFSSKIFKNDNFLKIENWEKEWIYDKKILWKISKNISWCSIHKNIIFKNDKISKKIKYILH